MPPRRVLMVALDAADAALIERWAADGALPQLGRLIREGTSGTLAASARYLAGSPWPTFLRAEVPAA